VAGPPSSPRALGGAEAGGRERAADEHSLRVEAVREQVRRFAAARTAARIYHRTTNSTRAQEFRRDAMIDAGGLDRVLHVDRERRLAVVDALRYVHLPDSAAIRAALDPLLRARRLYALLHATNISQDFFVQDLSMPAGSAVEMLEVLGRHVGVSPLWLCPLRPAGEDRLAPSALDADLVVNIGAWGAFRRPASEFVRVNRLVEREVAGLGGRKVLYAHAYYTPEEFWRIYDREWYAGLRDRCRADPVFPDLYEKVAVRDAYRRPALAKGIWRGLRRRRLPTA